MFRRFQKSTTLFYNRNYVKGIKPKVTKNDAIETIKKWEKEKFFNFKVSEENLNLIYIPIFRFTFRKEINFQDKVDKRMKKLNEIVSLDLFYYADTKYEKYLEGILQKYNINLLEEIGNPPNMLKVSKNPKDFYLNLEDRANKMMEEKVNEVLTNNFGHREFLIKNPPLNLNIEPTVEYFPVYKCVYKYLNNNFILFVNGYDKEIYGDEPKYKIPIATSLMIVLMATHYLKYHHLGVVGIVMPMIFSYGVHRLLQAIYVMNYRHQDETIENDQNLEAIHKKFEERREKFNIKDEKGKETEKKEFKFEQMEDTYKNVFERNMEYNEKAFELKKESTFVMPEIKIQFEQMTKDEMFQIDRERVKFNEEDDYYAILGLDKKIGEKYTEDTIKRSFEKMMKKLEKENRKELYEKVKRSYSIIGNRRIRPEYDNFLKKIQEKKVNYQK